MRIWRSILIVLVLTGLGFGQVKAPPNPPPDDRYKADILLVVAHPDDETEIAGYLARAIFDQHKRVAVIYGTRGNAGGNVVGQEQAAALGAVREIEARRALATLGIVNAWFLNGLDTPGQDVLRSLETWNHGASLDQVVRLVRLTRPEVILSWLPDYVVGENHGDHQASSVLATEAFDLAGDPTAFPEQVAPPRNRTAVGNLTEGLRVWQAKKIYYFSDTSHPDFLKGRGPKYSITEVSPSRHMPYNQIIAIEASEHLTQYGVGLVAKEALAKGDFHALEAPTQFVFGKSVVPGSMTGDIFEGVTQAPAPFATVPGYKPEPTAGLSLELGGPWAFYRRFWKAHNLDHLKDLVSPEAAAGADGLLYVPLILTNDTDKDCSITLQVSLPTQWVEKSGSGIYQVAARGSYSFTAVIAVPPGPSKQAEQVIWEQLSGGLAAGKVSLTVFPHQGGGLPQ
jgi:LmbE family N-acetylglucosaminyl deacetylase